MKNAFKIIILTLLISCNGSADKSFKVMTYNIRLDVAQDGENCWDKRKESMVELLHFYQPSILGIQEGLPHQVQYLDSALEGYSYIGAGRDDGKNAGEFSAIFFDSTKYNVISQATFWLSEYPDSVSFGWDAVCRRVCTYGLFESIANKRQFWVFNTHFDHIGVVAREKSAQLILSKISELNTKNLPVILMGDFNSNSQSRPVEILKSTLVDAISCSETKHYGPDGTFTGFNSDAITSDKIDYVFVSKLKVLSHIHIDDRRKDSLFVSDHLPVLVEVELK